MKIDMRKKSVINLYTRRAYCIILMIATYVVLLSCAFYTAGKLLGWFPYVSVIGLAVLDAEGILYTVLRLAFFRRPFDSNGDLLPGRRRTSKILLVIFTVVHFNLITYIIPSREFWAFVPFFMLPTAFFLDARLVIAEGAGLLASTFASWILLGDRLLPESGASYGADIAIRVVCLFLSAGALVYLVVLCNRLLVRDLETLSDYDHLTGLHNRRRMEEIIEEARDSGGEYSLAMLDIDDFKHINDTYGHNYGDTVLLRIAKLIKRNISTGETAFRFGGEEFLILFKRGVKAASEACEMLFEEIRTESFSPMQDVKICVTMTAGVGPLHIGDSVRDAIMKADSNLYRGKKTGKNQVVSDEIEG